MVWFYLSVFSVFALATAELTQQKLLNKKGAFNERTSAVLIFLVQSLLSFPLLILFGLVNQVFSIFTPAIFFKVLLVSLLASISMIFYLRSLKVRNISISAIFVSFSVVVSTFLGILIFSESAGHLKFFGIMLVMIAIFLINFKNSSVEKNHFYGLAAGFIFGISYAFDKNIVSEINPLVYIFWTFLLIAVWGFVFGRRKVLSSLDNRKVSDYKPILVSGAAYFLFNLSTFTAYTYGGEIGRIDAINNSQVFLIIMFEYFILKHTHNTAKKLLSAVLAVLGILLLGFVR